jgi:hypothetical protein
MVCDDSNPCTDDACDPDLGMCTTMDNEALCSDDDECTRDDRCAGGECVGGAPPNCNDGNICTIDGCNRRAGCFYLPAQSPCCIGEDSICDDGNPCTDDLCDPEGGDCIYRANTANCDDRNACTTDDTCDDEVCSGPDLVCDDGDDCTEDHCNPQIGCTASDLDAVPCDDGVECTTDDACVDGVCVGDEENCRCEPEFALDATRMNFLLLGTNGRPGQGLDVDLDPETCAPANDCQDGIDNALGPLGGIVNPPLQENVEDGSLNLILEYIGVGENPFQIAVHQGSLDPGNAECAVQTDRCDWRVTDELLDPETCERVVTLPARLEGNQLRAGGPGTLFPFQLPFGDAVVQVTLYEVQVVGTVTRRQGRVVMLDAVLGGAVRRDDLVEAINAIDPDQLPVAPETIVQILDIVVQDDVDTDNDGEFDAASIGLRVQGISGRIVGVR